jgi:uncharacterized protein DUF4288
MRYAANLLFKYAVDGQPASRPLCENRIVVLNAPSPREAHRRAHRYGKRQELRYRNADGRCFRITFLGLIDLVELIAGDPREVYYSMFRTARPERHVPSRLELSVFRPGLRMISSAWWAVPAFAARSVHRRGESSTQPRERAGTQRRRKSKRKRAGRSPAGR